MNSRADRALHYWHPFARSIPRGVGLSMRSSAYFASWLSVARFFLGIRRNTGFRSIRGQWVSITRELVDYLLEQEERALSLSLLTLLVQTNTSFPPSSGVLPS